jgi:tripartite ATP-independent transporter DctM subunit
MTITVVLALMFGMLLFGTPVAIALAVSGAVGLYMTGGVPMMLGILETTPLSTASSYELITIPMFILMAEFVILSGIADDLFMAAAAWIGRVRGGLAMATAIAGAGFGAISGSSTAAAATLSSTTIPAMMRQGYEPGLAAGVVAISGTLAMLIPPSIALILYGIIADIGIGDLLIGGVIPGLMVTVTIILTVAFLVWRDPSRAPPTSSYSWGEKFGRLKVVAPLLFLFGLVTGTIYSGIATPTEASGIGAFGALLLVWKAGRLRFAPMRDAVLRACEASCMIVFIVLGAHVFGYFFTLTRVTNDIVDWVGALEVSRWVILAMIIAGYVVLGFFMDQIAILILTVPVVLPVVVALGFDPVWFGVLVVVTAEVGMVTPPLGLNAFVVARYTKRPIIEVFRGIIPHFWAHLIVIAILAAFPSLVTWLPSTMR